MILKISASAGSGKTYTLTRRFLELLEKAAPEAKAGGCGIYDSSRAYSLAEILAATFTNKAAAEMKNRVVATLKEKALRERENKESSRDRGEIQGRLFEETAHNAEEWVERILRHYGSLNIRTIDSLLATLVRLSALELGLPPDFEPSFDAEEFFSPVYDGLMEDLVPDAGGLDAFFALQTLSGMDVEADRPLLSSLPSAFYQNPEKDFLSDEQIGFAEMDAATLRSSLASACRSMLYLTDFRGFAPGDRLKTLLLELVNRLLTGCEVPVMDTAALHARLRHMHSAMHAACERLLRIIEEEGLQANAHFRKYLAACLPGTPYSALPKSTYSQKNDLDECLNKASRGAASGKALSEFAEFMVTAKAFSQTLPVYKHALQLAPLTLLAHEIHKRMRLDLQESRRLPALCLPMLAGKVLSGEYGVSDALCRMGTRLSRLLLDEFQDTSHEQWAAILPLAAESLSSGGSLTYVGDVKQAIYGWRGGDARLFDAVPEEPELQAIVPDAHEINLEYNWRSHPKIVLHNNAFFRLLAREDIAFETLSAMLPDETPSQWAAMGALEAVKNFSKVEQKIPGEKHWERDPKGALATVRLYEVTADKVEAVQHCVRERLHRLFMDELLPSWSCGDIAVLVRSGQEASLVAEWLTEWGIPVVTENSFLLSSHPLVGRLISFLSFLDYPLDDLAFWEFAGTPECLGRLCSGCGMATPGPDWPSLKTLEFGKKRPPLYQLFRAEFPEAWHAWIEPFFAEAGLMSAYDTLREVIRRFLLMQSSPEQSPFLLRLLELAHLAETRGHSSLAAFLAFWDGCRDNEKLPLPENMDAVRIMTIHKAKGLEFPVVILPFQHRGRQREPELAIVTMHGQRILTRVEKSLPDLYYPSCVTDELERLNLLYVAWTRPVYALHAFITRPRTSTPLTRGLECLLQAYASEPESRELCQWEYLSAEQDSSGIFSDTQDISVSPPEMFSAEPGLKITEISDTGQATGKISQPDAVSSYRNRFKTPSSHFSMSWRPMDWLPRLKIYRSTLEGGSLSPKRRGILAHLCLEHLVLSKSLTEPVSINEGEKPGEAVHGHPARKRESLRRDVKRAVRQGMRLFPLPLEAPEAVAAEMEESLFWFANLPEAPFWLSRGLREQGIADPFGNMHRVDLLVEEVDHAEMDGAEGCLHAIDYKTGRYPDGESLRNHRQQVTRYMRLLRAARNRPVRGTLVYLDERRLEHVAWDDGTPVEKDGVRQ